MIRVLVVDDQPMMRRGIVMTIAEHGEMTVVGEAGSAQEALAGVAQHEPDVMVIETVLPDGDGLDVCSQISKTGVGVIVLTQYTNDRAVLRAFRHGARGYVVKASVPQELCHAIRAVSGGGTHIDPQVAEKVVNAAIKDSRTRGPFGLTPQELRVVELLPKRFTNQEIAKHLGVSHETVRTHLRHALRKLRVDDRTAAATVAVEAGLV